MFPRHDFSPQRRPSRQVIGDVGVLSKPVVLLTPEDVAARPPTRPTAGGPRPGSQASRRSVVTREAPNGKLVTSCTFMCSWHDGTSDDVLRLTSSSVRRRRVRGFAAGRWHDSARARHARRIERRDARAPQSFLRGVCRVIQA